MIRHTVLERPARVTSNTQKRDGVDAPLNGIKVP
jgi:hypothetical protein